MTAAYSTFRHGALALAFLVTGIATTSVPRTAHATDAFALRSDLSTWSASPLSRSDVALDAFGSFGSYPGQLRVTMGLLAEAPAGFDLGFAVRTMGALWDLEVRGRFGYRFANGLFALGGEIAPCSGLGLDGEFDFGVRAFAVASIHTLAPATETARRFGSVAFSVALGFEAFDDRLEGLVRRTAGSMSTNFAACDAVPTGNPDPCALATETRPPRGDQVVTAGRQVLVRPLVRASIEWGLGRHVNLFASVERVLADGSNVQFQRAYYESFWTFVGDPGRGDLLTYVHAGLTVKF